MIALYPTKAQVEALLANPDEGPVVMLNLLRFKERASEPDLGLSGEEAYLRYAMPIRALIEDRGGRFVWVGRVDAQVIGRDAEDFDFIALIEYPSRRVFVELATSADFAEIGIHRIAGLEGQWLIAAKTAPVP